MKTIYVVILCRVFAFQQNRNLWSHKGNGKKKMDAAALTNVANDY